jgi:hypothetical protein
MRRSGWTPERRRRMHEMIHRWKPWQQSTGPRTAEGKARVSRNAYKSGHRQQMRELARILREYAKEDQKIREALAP